MSCQHLHHRLNVGGAAPAITAVLACLFSLLGPRCAAASPILWQFDGSVAISTVSEFPVGTPVTFEWLADPATSNACAGVDPSVGVYFNQTLTERIGGLTYQINGILTVGTNVSRGCSGPPDGSVELRLIQWSGPSVSEGNVIPFWPCCTSPALLWSAFNTGAYPTDPPAGIWFQGPYFVPTGYVEGGARAVAATAVPEPASLTLLGLGGWMAYRATRRRALDRRISLHN